MLRDTKRVSVTKERERNMVTRRGSGPSPCPRVEGRAGLRGPARLPVLLPCVLKMKYSEQIHVIKYQSPHRLASPGLFGGHVGWGQDTRSLSWSHNGNGGEIKLHFWKMHSDFSDGECDAECLSLSVGTGGARGGEGFHKDGWKTRKASSHGQRAWRLFLTCNVSSRPTGVRSAYLESGGSPGPGVVGGAPGTAVSIAVAGAGASASTGSSSTSRFQKPGGPCFMQRMGEEASGERGLGTSGQSLEAWRPPASQDLAWGGPLWEAPLLGPPISQCGPWTPPSQ